MKSPQALLLAALSSTPATCLAALLSVLLTASACAADGQADAGGHRTFHVSCGSGNDSNPGTAHSPFKTISAAAQKAMPGDTVLVHGGVYRERVDPPRGGTSNTRRITYAAAPGEKAVITGSEPVKGWTKVQNDTWKVDVPNASFGNFNPYNDKVQGEWCERGGHTGAVYLNGDWLDEAGTQAQVFGPAAPLAAPRPKWFAKPEAQSTTIWAQFPGVDPNASNVEINVRQSVFYPSKTGINYITVREFELCRAATPWAGAMSEQVGLIGTHWSKGWIIEDNDIHHSVCTGVTLGRYALPKNEFPPATAEGFINSIKLALRDGWSKEKIGGHIVRRNHISHCEKNAIHGSLGAVYSEISGNDIHDICTRGWLKGADTAGIKFLCGVDMVIRDNHIYRCGQMAGIWIDWMGQGTQVSGNLLHDNTGIFSDIFLEMQHGPIVVANNIFLSNRSLSINSEGLALVHNLVAGTTANFNDPRTTPFQPAHALTLAGVHAACGGDHRVHNNLFIGNWTGGGRLPNFSSGNVFTGSATPFTFAPAKVPNFDAKLKLTQKANGWYLALAQDKTWRNGANGQLVTTQSLGKAAITKCAYENADGSPLTLDTDYFGKKRDARRPFPGPFETPVNGEVKVWPK